MCVGTRGAGGGDSCSGGKGAVHKSGTEYEVTVGISRAQQTQLRSKDARMRTESTWAQMMSPWTKNASDQKTRATFLLHVHAAQQ